MGRRALVVSLMVLSACNAPQIQPPPTVVEPITVDRAELQQHLLNPPDWSALDINSPFTKWHSVKFDAVIGTDGKVESLTPTGGDLAFVDEARRSIGNPVFKPFMKEGLAVRAKVSFQGIAAEPDPAPLSVPFPDIKDLRKVSISLSRSGCYGTCPTYKVTIRGDGTVHFIGSGYGKPSVDETEHLPERQIIKLLSMLRDMDFFSLRDRYVQRVTDNPTYTVSATIDDRSKTIVDYVGIAIGMPSAITDLENMIDYVADTPRWISGTSYNVETLNRQGFDFRSSNGPEILNALAGIANLEAIEDFEKAGAKFQDDKGAWNALANASRRGKSSIVAHLLKKGIGASNHQALTDALYQAAVHGHMAIARSLIASGADPRGKDQRSNVPIIYAAALSGNPELVSEILKSRPSVSAIQGAITSAGVLYTTPVIKAVSPISWKKKPEKDVARIIEELCAAGADANVVSFEGSALQMTTSPKVAKALLDCGADPNARGRDEMRPLDRIANEEMARLLIERGADVKSPDPNGITIAERAEAYHWQSVIALINGKAAPGR